MATDIKSESATIDVTGRRDQPNLSGNLEFWMTYLPAKLRAFPIIHLAIPGKYIAIIYNTIL